MLAPALCACADPLLLTSHCHPLTCAGVDATRPDQLPNRCSARPRLLCSQNAAPDVVYSYTPAFDQDVTISTCGSQLDTMLILSTNLEDLSTYTCNGGCMPRGGTPAAVHLSVRLPTHLRSPCLIGWQLISSTASTSGH
jgi:hypothetical protein